MLRNGTFPKYHDRSEIGVINMRVSDAKIRVYDLPLNATYKNSLAAKVRQKSIALMLSTEDGQVGISSIEPDTPNYSEETWYEIQEVVNREFLPLLMSSDTLEIPLFCEKMNERVYGHLMSKSLVETALYDLKAKSQNVPVSRILGQTIDRPIPLIGWVGIGSKDKRLQETRSWLDAGYKCIKYKISRDLDDFPDLIYEARKQFGYGFRIRIDANQGLTENLANNLIGRIEKFEISLLEQPIEREDIQGMASITKKSGIPIMADESAFSFNAVKNLIRAGACNIVKIKVMRSGGITEAGKIASFAESNGIRCVIGNGFSTSLGTSIEANFYLGTPTSWKYPDMQYAEFVGPLKLKEDIVRNRIQIQNGSLIPRHGPGFGYSNEELRDTGEFI